MQQYLEEHPDLTFVCWQGELCGPTIQKNPHNLKESHLFMFHWTDDTGRWNIVDAKKAWIDFGCEVVPIINTDFILPDDFEEFKLQADGVYDSLVCEGQDNCPREGFVYYKSTDPTFSFKNVSRNYLLSR